MLSRWIARRTLLLAMGCAGLAAAGLTGVALKSRASTTGPATPSQAKACIALAIDRDTGTTSAVPCTGTELLIAQQVTAGARP